MTLAEVTHRASPFLKWAGGKRQLLPELLARIPEHVETYFEPFIGGGALFFALASEGRFNKAVLSDTNPDLVTCYQAVRDDVEGVITALQPHIYEQDYYYLVRGLDPKDLTVAERAARTIYLNRTCFNGLYRVNRSGSFNVPFGRYANPVICDQNNLRACSATLRGVELVVADFAHVTAKVGSGDLVYFDPPYVPVSTTAAFTQYTSAAFGPREHERLRDLAGSLIARQVRVLLSNSSALYVRDLYAGDAFVVEEVSATRAVNSKAERRGAVTELLIVAAPRP